MNRKRFISVRGEARFPPIPEQMYSDPEMSWALQLSQACLVIDPNYRASAMELLKICSSQKIDCHKKSQKSQF